MHVEGVEVVGPHGCLHVGPAGERLIPGLVHQWRNQRFALQSSQHVPLFGQCGDDNGFPIIWIARIFIRRKATDKVILMVSGA